MAQSQMLNLDSAFDQLTELSILLKEFWVRHTYSNCEKNCGLNLSSQDKIKALQNSFRIFRNLVQHQKLSISDRDVFYKELIEHLHELTTSFMLSFGEHFTPEGFIKIFVASKRYIFFFCLNKF